MERNKEQIEQKESDQDRNEKPETERRRARLKSLNEVAKARYVRTMQ
jgi:hypothetical protein